MLKSAQGPRYSRGIQPCVNYLAIPKKKNPKIGFFILLYIRCVCVVSFVLFTIVPATGYRNTIIIVFKAVAGNTTPINNAVKGIGKPTSNSAEVRNTVPEIIVPIAVKIPTLIMEF